MQSAKPAACRRAFVAWLSGAAITSCLLASEPPTYRAHLIPGTLGSPIGVFDILTFDDFNAAGQVYGKAWASANVLESDADAGIIDPRECIQVPFFFSPGEGFQIVDPSQNFGGFTTELRSGTRDLLYGAWGTAEAFIAEGEINCDLIRVGLFRMRAGGALRSLDDQFPADLIDGLFETTASQFTYADELGHVVLYFATAGERFETFLRTPGQGWRSIRGLAPQEAQESVLVRGANAAGDLVLHRGLSGGRQRVYVNADGTTTALSNFGADVTVPAAQPSIDNSGRTAGLSLTSDRQEHAFYYSRQQGMVDIHPAGFVASAALHLSRNGTALGIVRERGAGGQAHGLFVYHPQRGLRIVTSRAQIEALLPAGSRMRFLRFLGGNRRHEIAFRVYWSRDGVAGSSGFLYRPDSGLHSIAQLLAAAGQSEIEFPDSVEYPKLAANGSLWVQLASRTSGRPRHAILLPSQAPGPVGGDDCPLPLGHGRYCDVCGPCQSGEGDCDADGDCAAGLICESNVGSSFGFPAAVDVCLPAAGGDAECPLPPGHGHFCAVCGPCPSGLGDCDSDAECAAGLTCQDNRGADFGFRPAVDVCL